MLRSLLIFILCIGQCQAHIVEQLFVDFDTAENEWIAEIRFDAGIALPEMRADKEALQPKRAWLINQTPTQHETLREEAEKYIRQIFKLGWRDSDEKFVLLEYSVVFPEWSTTPPVFAKPFTDLGFAYFTIQCHGSLPPDGFDLIVNISEGDHPDFAFGFEQMGSSTILTAYPGKSLILIEDESAPSEEKSFLNFLEYGFRHVIPKGLDHVLFIAALCLLSLNWKPLLTQSLIFTLGHTITLGLVVCDVIPAPSGIYATIVETVIAVSIFYVAIENLWQKKLKKERLITVLIFGLIHGIGFASVLGASIRSSESIFVPLLAANLGVELGQIVVIGVVLASLYWFKGKVYFSKITKSLSVFIAITAAYWVIERVLTI